MRKLTTIRTIEQILPIKDADRIELAIINGGWECVVGKDEFKIGEQVLYFEIDSILPADQSIFKGFEKGFTNLYDGSRGLRVRTIKLRGQISQGIVMKIPPNFLINGDKVVINGEVKSIDDDFSYIFNVWKYDPPVPMSIAGDVEGFIPEDVIKTDENRFQNLKVEQMIGEWSVTEKIDGTSSSIWVDGLGNVKCAGHNYVFRSHNENGIVTLFKKSGLFEYLRKYYPKYSRLVFQGEYAGPGIQKNPLKLRNATWFLFSAHYRGEGNKISQDELERLYAEFDDRQVDKELIKLAPRYPNHIISEDQANNPHTLLEMANVKSLVNPSQNIEGLVLRNVDNPNKSFKIISNDYLLKHERDS